ncbi:MAG: carbohydrate kinase [Armatimonadetes bacterium RBG_16_58_9]|nr:MAG: carbohydrate kinase [Armatimonadetes bacterium RBG_16_58_9]
MDVHKNSNFLAFDFGAESGRALLGTLDGGKLHLREIHRFPNCPVWTLGHLHWDVLKLFDEVKHGLKIALDQTGGDLDGIGVDTWGVDFGLFSEDGELLGNPFHYRDERTNGMLEAVTEIVPREEIFEHTGIQFIQVNTLYQLYSMVLTGSTALKCASTLLFTPDLFNYWLTGQMTSEYSIATTSQCYDPRKGDWATEILDKLGIPTGIFQKVVQPGTTIGCLASTLARELGAGECVPVVAPACHDTGSAVAAVPSTEECPVYISSGTWSLMGAELDKPLINENARQMGFANEGGVAGTIRFLHNIMGLWLVQECRRTWLAAGEDVSYAELARMAEASDGFVSVVDPDAGVFLTPGDMPERIRQFCRETGQNVPESKGEVVRCALDSLALRYRDTMEKLDELLEKRFDRIHIVGGGTQNTLLCQLAADATGRTVVAGPVEATAIGNVLVQAMGRGVVGSLAEVREIVRSSFEMVTYEPHPSGVIDRAYETFKHVAS